MRHGAPRHRAHQDDHEKRRAGGRLKPLKEAKTMPKRILQGTVVSDKNDKTVVVKVERRVKHPVFKKIRAQSKKFMAHDETNSCKVGDRPDRGMCARFRSKSAGSSMVTEADRLVAKR
jgi:small subunit ribosomal protein S17